MRLIPSDPDVETIVSRIKRGDLDLQPNFQRGEVWTDAKKRKLIDSILRDWHVPPIHIIKGQGDGKDVVLDGQQRLSAVRDFLTDKLTVNGKAEPLDEKIVGLHGLTFSELPEEWRRKVTGFPIRIFNIVDYKPSEPSELFYRLNQPTALTAAEQRNSFFGKPREQIKELADLMEKRNLDAGFLGFSNARMAYDDTLSRVCVALETGLGAKTGATLLADRYRSGEPFNESAVQICADAIELLSEVRAELAQPFHLNKASLFSWLIFLCRAPIAHRSAGAAAWAEFFKEFESDRMLFELFDDGGSVEHQIRAALYDVYNDRVKSRVADVSSVLLRDLALWGAYACQDRFDIDSLEGSLRRLRVFLSEAVSNKGRPTERALLEFASDAKIQWERVR
ncbi:protein of unknown function DUF262 [Burkholderia sp. MR1]|nr:protein of unknown function DUF262 [Burkholderia sp. MR1]